MDSRLPEMVTGSPYCYIPGIIAILGCGSGSCFKHGLKPAVRQMILWELQ